MPSQADLAAAFARMRQNNAEAGAGIRNGAIDLHNVYGDHLGDAPSIPPMTFGGKGSSGDETPLWLKALEGISSTGKLVTNQFANWSDHHLDWKDIPFAESLMQGAKAQVGDWTDGKLSWGDVPGFGFLHGIGTEGKGFGDTLKNLGAKPGGYLEKIGGLEGDILFDPLNLVTFGSGSAVKAGAKAAQIAAKEAGKLGLTGEKAVQYAADAAAAARNKTQNALINFDVPFTKITKQFGQKPEFFKIKDAKIGDTGAAAVSDLFQKAGLNSDQMAQVLKNNYRVNTASDLTTQGLKHLQEELTKIPKNTPVDDVSKYFTDASQLFDGTIPATKGVFDELPVPRVTGLPANVSEQGLQDILGKLALEGDSVTAGTVAQRAVKPRNVIDAEPVVNDPLVNLNKFVQDMGGKSDFGNMVSKVNPFDARTFKSADALANKSAGDLRNAETQIHGRIRQANDDLRKVAKTMKDFTEVEKKAVVYTIENAFPKAFDKTTINEAKVKAAADQIKPLLKQWGERDLASGTVSNLIENYFPHVLSKDSANLTKEQLSRIIGRSQANNFGKARTGFDNFAQLEDAIHGLTQAGKLDEAAELSKLFERNPLDALGYRAYKSSRSSTMAELFSQMEKDGLLAKPSTELSHTKVHAGSEGYHKLNADEAKSLGLEPGTMIHKDVFEGMKNVRELFTDKGMNNLLDKMNQVVNIWKSLVTTAIPAHYVNNFIGNIANNTLAGVKVGSYNAASDLLKRMKLGNLSTEEQKIVQAAYDKGVFGSGFSSDFVRSQFTKPKDDVLSKISGAINDNKIVKGMRTVGDRIDDFSRLALFLHGYKQTNSLDKAGDMVRKFLFNYTERSKGDNVMRTVAPFWMWTKNNLPLQIQQFMQQPRYYSTYKKVMDAFNEDVKDGNKSYKTDNYIHLPGTNIGLPVRALPMNDLGMFGTGLGDTARSALGMAAPTIKAPVELSLNKQFFNNQPVYYKDKEAEGITRYLLNQTGALGKAVNIFDGQGNDFLDLLAPFMGKPVEYK